MFRSFLFRSRRKRDENKRKRDDNNKRLKGRWKMKEEVEEVVVAVGEDEKA